MRSLARVVVVCGLAVALTAATVGSAFFGVTTWLTLVPLAGGLLAAAAGALAGLTDLRRAAKHSHTPRLIGELALVAALVVAANVGGVYLPFVADITRSKRNTLAEASIQVARALTAPVVVRTSLAGDDRASLELAELVGRYTRASAFVSLEHVSAATDPEAARAFAAGGDEKVVVTSGERRQRVRFVAGSPDQEEQLTNALRSVSTGKRLRIYVLAGHAEAALDDEGPAGLRRFGQALVDEGLEVVPLPLAVVGRVPDDAAAVVVAAAAQIPDAERALLQRYLDDGGRLCVLLEPGAEALAGLLGSVGVQPSDDVIIDGSAFSGLLGGPETATGVAYASHPVTQKLQNAMTHFPRARSLSENPGTQAVVTALVQTGAEAFGETHLAPGSPPSFDAADTAGPLTLAMAVTSGKARVLVVGDATFAENQGLGLGANRDFAVNGVLWLVEREGTIAVRARGRGGNLLLLTPTARERIAFTLLYGLPVLLLCAGLAITAMRRRR